METLKHNFMRLQSMEELKQNWNGYQANPIDPLILTQCKRLIPVLLEQPRITPVATNSVQMEYKKANGDYLEFEIHLNYVEMYMVIGDTEYVETLASSPACMNEVIERFYC